MGVLGLFVLSHAAWSIAGAHVPEHATMGALALLANLAVAILLFAWRKDDANMRSVWLCTRNDAIGNLAVMAAAAGVFGSGRPDWGVAFLMGALALTAGYSVMRQAGAELAAARQ